MKTYYVNWSVEGILSNWGIPFGRCRGGGSKGPLNLGGSGKIAHGRCRLRVFVRSGKEMRRNMSRGKPRKENQTHKFKQVEVGGQLLKKDMSHMGKETLGQLGPDGVLINPQVVVFFGWCPMGCFERET